MDEGKNVQGYPILLGPVEVPRRARRELSCLLMDRRNYGYIGVDDWPPVAAFRFYGKNTVIEVLVSNGDMAVFEHGEIVFEAPICPVQNKLIQLVNSFLPKARM